MSNEKTMELKYAGSLETFYKYIKILIENEITEEEMKKLFNNNFSFTGNPNRVFPTVSEITKFYNGIRNDRYSEMCHPYKFATLKFDKLSYFPLSEKSVMIALLDIFHTTPNQTPRFKMAFIYTLTYNDEQKAWLFNNLTRLDVDLFPKNWIEVEIREGFKYDSEMPLNELESFIAR